MHLSTIKVNTGRLQSNSFTQYIKTVSSNVHIPDDRQHIESLTDDVRNWQWEGHKKRAYTRLSIKGDEIVNRRVQNPQVSVKRCSDTTR